jgi:hypothetical protein
MPTPFFADAEFRTWARDTLTIPGTFMVAQVTCVKDVDEKAPILWWTDLYFHRTGILNIVLHALYYHRILSGF